MIRTSRARIRVLYVEDERGMQYAIARVLRILGYEVTVAPNGKEGVDLAKSWKPHFILMDIQMPIMNGTEAIRILRSCPETADIPIYVLTALPKADVLAECEAAGADGHFSKPPPFNQLHSTIKEMVRKKAP